ncbi:MAG: DUF362 domain-containing protein [Acetomicrobium sp.]|jgi:uncharacterized protein (DUF362 family)/Pyruvate/2-oxoacid:ferredoxin oxidoreductase delta subunit|uniref:DUF362 domain-containing protein n=1 Tax=Acetomicrobium TaxID=49894 RepID=UPI0016B0A32D|nr:MULTISPECIES: DUF362 domain-containing protein [Acetomicrobium]MDI9376632.1 DUF362 domain-containing protein [Synergistota bacterium]NLI43190.1 DUF362 domain-containing protein [Synergistaceae bacterium]MDR9770796.1 DUF362 domain-containing protein [Acetomicrobium sp.]HOB10932.1 DUF362 domain-containing protein [Acetomicrobium sp.]HQA35904.1 DUF362 domain-containing protein [Acetomicrobium sp.]
MTDKFLVSVSRCSSYEADEVYNALADALEMIGGWPKTNMPNELLFKTNLLAPKPPDKAVTTHPSVVRALIKLVRNSGFSGKITVADSPGHLHADKKEELLKLTGMLDAVKDDGNAVATILSDAGFVTLKRPSNVVLKDLSVSKRYYEAPFVVNIAKLKTHVETEITACVKNCFGIADTDTRKKAHLSTSINRLCNAIIDLYSINPPKINILDGIYAMEGNGPTHGKPRFAGLLMASENALAVDFVAAKAMGYKDPLDIPLINLAAKRGIGPSSMSDITIIGIDPDNLEIKGFAKRASSSRMLPTWLRGWAHRWVALSPHLQEVNCIRCGVCVKVCPKSAIKMNPLPEIDRRICVKCLCCHEMCPTGAMEVRENFIMKLLRM